MKLAFRYDIAQWFSPGTSRGRKSNPGELVNADDTQKTKYGVGCIILHSNWIFWWTFCDLLSVQLASYSIRQSLRWDCFKVTPMGWWIARAPWHFVRPIYFDECWFQIRLLFVICCTSVRLNQMPCGCFLSMHKQRILAVLKCCRTQNCTTVRSISMLKASSDTTSQPARCQTFLFSASKADILIYKVHSLSLFVAWSSWMSPCPQSNASFLERTPSSLHIKDRFKWSQIRLGKVKK